MNFYGDLPDTYNLVINPNHRQIIKLSGDITATLGPRLEENTIELKRLSEEADFMEKENSKKKPEEISQLEKDDLEKKRKELDNAKKSRKEILGSYGSDNKIVKQLIDLALLSNNMLRGEDLNSFVRRSVELL